MISVRFHKVLQCLLLMVIVLGFAPPAMTTAAAQQANALLATKTYLPMVNNIKAANLPLMTGVYAGWPDQTNLDNHMRPLDNWLTGVNGGRSTSIFASFLPLELPDGTEKANVEMPLTLVWNAGYVMFINLPTSGYTAAQVANGALDGEITKWAQSYKNFANGGKRFAYLAPMQEMNSDWVSYGGKPADFKNAFKRFQNLFTQAGVPRQSVKWVYAPNGWAKAGTPQFEDYYPGDAYVDVVSFSAYNFGVCNGAKSWQSPEVVFNNPNSDNGHYLDRMRAMAPSKPIFIAQTATSSYTAAGVKNAAAKEQWLRDAYAYLANQKNVRAILYFDENKECDWAIFGNGSSKNPGYKTAVTSNGYRYIAPGELLTIDHVMR